MALRQRQQLEKRKTTAWEGVEQKSDLQGQGEEKCNLGGIGGPWQQSHGLLEPDAPSTKAGLEWLLPQ